MRKISKALAGVLAPLLLFGGVPASAKSTDFVPAVYAAEKAAVPTVNLIEDGASDYIIVHGAQASPSEVTAAEKLADYLERVSGFAMPLVTDDEPARGPEIIVGKTNREGGAGFHGIDRAGLGDDGFVIRTVENGLGKHILIAGGEKRGALYGVFDFLEKFCGCRWFAPEITVVPETSTVAVPDKIDERETPAYLYRSPQINFGFCYPETGGSVDYCLANRITGHMATAVADEKYGGVLDYQIGGAYFITNNEALYGEHPDWFAMDKKGERVFGEYGSPCMSNEGVIQYYIDYALAQVEANPDVACIGMGLNDTALSCQCENCRAVYEEEGTLGKSGESGGTQARLFARVSEALDAAGSPAKLGTHAYAANAEAPKKTKYPDRAMIYFAPIGACYAHPFETCSYKGTANHRRQLEDWGRAGGSFIQFDYPCNYDHWNAPYPLWAALQPNLRYFYENGFIGLFNCGGSERDASFFNMTAWLYGKLLWDPYRDMEALYEEFLPLYYGGGWQYVREYIRIASEELTGRKIWGRQYHFERTSGPAKKGLLSMSGKQLKYIDALWKNAKALAREGWQLENLRRAEISWRVWKADTLRGEFSVFEKRAQNNRRLLSDIWELGLTQHGFHHKYITAEQSDALRIHNLTPRYWTGRMLGYTTVGGVDGDGNDRGPARAKNFLQLLWGWIFW
jgi:hypothetical protein